MRFGKDFLAFLDMSALESISGTCQNPSKISKSIALLNKVGLEVAMQHRTGIFLICSILKCSLVLAYV